MTDVIRAGTYLEDLKEIDDYISTELLNPNAALKIVLGIDDAVEKLAVFPKLGPELVFGGGINSGLRYLVHEKYIIVYQLREENVYIL